MKFRTVRVAIAVAAVALLAAACGGDNEIGGDLEADGSTKGSGAIGQATTTTAAPVATTGVVTTLKTTATTAKAPPCHTVYINNDTQGASFEPEDKTQTQISCTAGRYIHFVNRDNDPEHAYHELFTEPANPELTSPQLRYNDTWDAKVTKKGSFTLKDRQRPYATFVINVT